MAIAYLSNLKCTDLVYALLQAGKLPVSPMPEQNREAWADDVIRAVADCEQLLLEAHIRATDGLDPVQKRAVQQRFANQ